MEDVYEKNEFEVKHIRAYSKKCVGCQRHRKAVMISISPVSEERYDIKDFFLTKKQAKDLYDELGRCLIENTKPFNECEIARNFKGEPE